MLFFPPKSEPRDLKKNQKKHTHTSQLAQSRTKVQGDMRAHPPLYSTAFHQGSEIWHLWGSAHCSHHPVGPTPGRAWEGQVGWGVSTERGFGLGPELVAS